MYMLEFKLYKNYSNNNSNNNNNNNNNSSNNKIYKYNKPRTNNSLCNLIICSLMLKEQLFRLIKKSEYLLEEPLLMLLLLILSICKDVQIMVILMSIEIK